MDAFAFHPYWSARRPPTGSRTRRPRRSRSPTTRSSSRCSARPSTAPRSAGSTLPIYYTEFGVQSRIPAQQAALYTNLDSPRAQGRGSRDACRPRTTSRRSSSRTASRPCRGLFIFHIFDEPDLDRWQSGLYYADATPKSSLAGVQARRGRPGATTGLPALHCRVGYSPRGRPVRRVQLLPGRPRLAAAADRRARRRQGRVRRGGRGLGRPHGRAARLLGHRRAAGMRLLPLEDHRALRGPRRARRRAQRDPARRLARDAVLVPRDDEGVRVHDGAQAPEDRPEGLAVPRRLPVREAAALVRAVRRRTASARWTSTCASATSSRRSTTTRRTRSGSTTRSS